MMSKLRSALIVVSTNATSELVAQPRQRDREELAHGAGAVDARRVVELVGIFCTPATKSTMQSPNVTQVPITPIDGSAQVKSPSQGAHERAEADQLEDLG